MHCKVNNFGASQHEHRKQQLQKRDMRSTHGTYMGPMTAGGV